VRFIIASFSQAMRDRLTIGGSSSRRRWSRPVEIQTLMRECVYGL